MRLTALPPTNHNHTAEPCTPCTQAVAETQQQLEPLKDAGILIACACAGRPPQTAWAQYGQETKPAASLIKLAWILAATQAHHDGDLDLDAPVPVKSLPSSQQRDILDTLPRDLEMPLNALLGLGLTTSSNTIFEYLHQNTTVSSRVHNIDGVQVASGFSDHDLQHAIHHNLTTPHAAVQMLTDILRSPEKHLTPIRLGLINGARTTRLVRDIDDRTTRRPLHSPNKTGTLTGVRNDVAAITDGNNTLVIAVLTHGRKNGHTLDSNMANLGAALTKARWAT